MTELLTTIVYFLIALIILVAVHEFGHFYVARRCGVRVLRFSIGFGRRLFRWRDSQGTEYAISAVPLGGYVKMLDEREGEVEEEDLPFAFNRKPVPQRIAVAAAGPVANFLLAIGLYWLIFMQGTVSYAPVVGEVEPGSIAAAAGLEPGQEIVAVDGNPVSSRRDFELHLMTRLGETGEISFSVRYPESTLVYESRAQLDGWLKGEEAPDLMAGLGLSYYHPPVLPEVAMAQACGVLGFKTSDKTPEQGSIYLFAGIDNVRFKRQVVPGDRVYFEAKIVSVKRGIWKFDCTAKVDDQLVTCATIMCADRPVG